MNENKRSKIDEFRQFKKQIRGSTEVLVVGLDIGKRKHHAFLGSANGQTVLKGLIVENSAEGFAHLLTQVGFYMQRDGFKRVVFGLEPTSVYHKPLAEHLIAVSVKLTASSQATRAVAWFSARVGHHIHHRRRIHATRRQHSPAGA